jgi:molybdopterin-guanine dinucleotide biosynthesis protein A
MLSVAIQAGGESRRMGKDKALLSFLGEPLISRVLKRIYPLGADEVIVTTNRPGDYEFLGLPLYQDILPGTGALGGLCTALNFAQGELLAVVACDMPFVNLDILRLARDSVISTGVDLSIPRTEDGFEPFHAVYRRETCLPAVQKALDAGERKLISWFPSVRISTLNHAELLEFDPLGVAFWNINTPDELLEAEQLAGSIG